MNDMNHIQQQNMVLKRLFDQTMITDQSATLQLRRVFAGSINSISAWGDSVSHYVGIFYPPALSTVAQTDQKRRDMFGPFSVQLMTG